MTTGPKRSPNIHVAIAGPVRDCGDGLAARLTMLADTLDTLPEVTASFFLFENDSIDGTLDVLLRFASSRPRVHVVHEQGLHDRVRRREARLATCRNALLDVILDTLKADCDGGPTDATMLYLPVDLDLPIPWSEMQGPLRSAFDAVLAGHWNGVFPTSYPYYYDIHALRAEFWNEDDAWNRLSAAKRARSTSHLPKWMLSEIHIFARQVSSRRLARIAPFLPVTSAFGGLGVYRLDAVARQRYVSTPVDRCEHVVFNRGIDRLAIMTELIIPAPFEHLGDRSRRRPHQLGLRMLLHQMLWWRWRLTGCWRNAAQIGPSDSREHRSNTMA